ncbi:MAG: ATP synthase subunit I [Marinobacter sp.]|nr:ATP synthase subunit I [Marinobacter sp.]
MNSSRKPIVRLPMARWLAIMVGMLMIQSLLWLLCGWVAFYSAWLGGLIFVIPNAYFTHRVFKHQGARLAPYMVNELFKGEAIKFSLTAVMFAAVFLLIEPVHVLALLFTFAVMVVTGAVVPWLVKPQQQR